MILMPIVVECDHAGCGRQRTAHAILRRASTYGTSDGGLRGIHVAAELPNGYVTFDLEGWGFTDDFGVACPEHARK